MSSLSVFISSPNPLMYLSSILTDAAALFVFKGINNFRDWAVLLQGDMMIMAHTYLNCAR